MSSFSKVSFDQFKRDWLDTFDALADVPEDATEDEIKEHENELNKHIHGIYDNIKLPKRATAQSAGYDFFSPMSFVLEPNDSIKIPTGIRCEMYDGWVLMGFPRSGLGFKYGIRMANTVSIIDGDYFDSDNEGHIFIKIVNDGALSQEIRIDKGSAFCQGVFVPFGITLDDDTTDIRNGGLGSTGK